MKKVIIAFCLAIGTTALANEKVHTNKSEEEMACAKKCYKSIRALWRSGTITIEEAQKLWLEHKKK